MVFLVEFIKSIKPTQLFMESPENLIPLEEKRLNSKNFHNSLIQEESWYKKYQINKNENLSYSVPFKKIKNHLIKTI